MITTLAVVLLCFAVSLLVLALHLRDREEQRYKTTVRTMLHEMKNSLTALQFAEDDACKNAEIQRLTNLVISSGDYLKNTEGNPVKIEIVGFVNEIAKLFGNRVKVSCINVNQCFIKFDRDRARSVFENLIKNACESSNDGNAFVEVEIEKIKKSVSVRILDRGTGIDGELKDKLFEPFFTTKENGSGIGLPTAKQFVEAQKGKLKLYPREGGGTVAEVLLPTGDNK